MKTSEISMDQINKLIVSVSENDLKIKPIKGDKFILTYPESESLHYELNVTKHKIEIKKEFKIKLMSWFEFTDQSAVVTIEVPEAYLGSMDITCKHGNAEMNDLKNLSLLTVDFGYGDFQMDNINAEQIELNFAHGVSKLDTMSADSLIIIDAYTDSEFDDLKINKTMELSSRHGSLRMRNAEAEILSADFEYSSLKAADCKFNGSNKITYLHEDIEIENCLMDNLRIKGSYGNLELIDNKVNIITADVKHGDIYGNLQGKKEDYLIAATVRHGESGIEEQKPADYKYSLDIALEYGNAEINFAK